MKADSIELQLYVKSLGGEKLRMLRHYPRNMDNGAFIPEEAIFMVLAEMYIIIWELIRKKIASLDVGRQKCKYKDYMQKWTSQLGYEICVYRYLYIYKAKLVCLVNNRLNIFGQN